MKKILLDARTLNVKGGPAVYAENLIKGFKDYPGYYFYVMHPSRYHKGKFNSSNIEEIFISQNLKIKQLWWDNYTVYKWAKKTGSVLIHALKNTSPLYSKIPVITTLHDIQPFLYGGNLGFAEKWFWRFNMYNALKKSKKIITVSNYEKENIKKRFPRFAGKIEAVHLGIEDFFYNDGEPDYKNSDYFTAVGTVGVKKNSADIIKGFLKFTSSVNKNYKLKILGRFGYKGKELYEKYKNNPSIEFSGFIESREETARVIQKSRGVIFPSRMESFGLPALEGMASKVPVITTKDTSCAEICGDCAYYINGSVSAHTVAEALAAAEEGQTENLIQKAFERAKEFSIKKMRGETVKIYETI